VKAHEEVAYRLALAQGFLGEAEQDLTLSRWRSCVDNAQLVVENAGKAVLALFEVTPKTHDPAQHLASILRTQELPASVQKPYVACCPIYWHWARQSIF
jgi:HEPN domain-containing protein